MGVDPLGPDDRRRHRVADLGAYLALGGNRGLASAGEAPEAVRECRQAGEAGLLIEAKVI